MVYRTKEAAEQIGCNPATVVRACHRAGFSMVAGRFLLSQSQIRKLKKIIREKSGNPNFVPGNYLGRPRKENEK
jgi:hypothetical protein